MRAGRSQGAMKVPRMDPTTKEFLEAILPDDSTIVMRPMFGNESGFVNGHMFAGIFGTKIFIRLPDKDRNQLLGEPGATIFEPMEGRPMTEYVALPDAWKRDPERARMWVRPSFRWVSTLPPKAKSKRKR